MKRMIAMRLSVITVVLAGLLLGLGPLAGPAAAHRLPGQAPTPGPPAAPVTLPAGFSSVTKISGLTTPSGFVMFPFLDFFPCCSFIVEQPLNRVSRFDGAFLFAFATGLQTPSDVVSPGEFGTTLFGNFLYVAEAGANRISKIDQNGIVTVFASLPASPERMALTPDPGAFGTFLFVTLADGRLVKVDPTGAVTACASGLAGPRGLVFGPGGSAYKTALYVAESIANRISKVDATCTVTPFATTGLTSPVGLAISPGGGWGTVDTLFVENASTRIDQVDKNGTVTPFASGFTQADTVRAEFLGPLPGRLGQAAFVSASDAVAGTVTALFIQGPSVTPALAGCNPCHVGDTFTLNITFGNPGPLALPLEVKGGFEFPDGTPLNFAPVLNDKHFETVMAAGLASTTMSWLSLPVPAIAPGRYCYVIGVGDPELFDASVLSNRACFNVVP